MDKIGKNQKKWMLKGMHKLADELMDDFLELSGKLPAKGSHEKRLVRTALKPIEDRLLKALNGEYLDGTAYQKGMKSAFDVAGRAMQKLFDGDPDVQVVVKKRFKELAE